MKLFKKLFGSKESKKEQPHQVGNREILELKKKTEETFDLLECLTAFDTFGRTEMSTYISLSEEYREEIPANKKEQMLNADKLIIPQKQDNGEVVDGFGQLRQTFIQVHMDEVSLIIKMLRALPQTKDNAELLKFIINRLDTLRKI